MSAIAETLTIDQWQILFHETMAAVLRAKEAVKRKAGILGVASGLWTCARDLKAFNDRVKMLTEAPDDAIGSDSVARIVRQFEKLLSSIDGLVSTGEKYGLLNRTLTGYQIRMIMARRDDFARHLESLEMSVNPDVLAAIQAGQDEIANGDFEILERLF